MNAIMRKIPVARPATLPAVSRRWDVRGVDPDEPDSASDVEIGPLLVSIRVVVIVVGWIAATGGGGMRELDERKEEEEEREEDRDEARREVVSRIVVVGEVRVTGLGVRVIVLLDRDELELVVLLVEALRLETEEDCIVLLVVSRGGGESGTDSEADSSIGPRSLLSRYQLQEGEAK